MFYTTKGLILRETAYKDNDKILTILTEERGKITAKARGVRRKNSRLRAGCQLLNFSEFTFFEQKGYYTVNECEPVMQFTGIREDLEALSLCSYFAQVLETIAPEEQPEPEMLALGLNCIYAADRKIKPNNQVKAAFEIRLMLEAGFQPELSVCVSCGGEAGHYFSHLGGGVVCDTCAAEMEAEKPAVMNPSVRSAMNHILTCERGRILTFSLDDQDMLQLGNIAEQYLLAQLGQGFSTLRFYHSLFTCSVM